MYYLRVLIYIYIFISISFSYPFYFYSFYSFLFLHKSKENVFRLKSNGFSVHLTLCVLLIPRFEIHVLNFNISKLFRSEVFSLETK